MNTSEATTAAREAGDSPVVEWGARLGFVVVGVIHLLIAWIALRVAWGIGGGTKKADTSGALQTMSSSGTGTVVLWVCVLGFLLLAVWQLLEAAVGHGEASDRAKSGAKGVTYLVFAWTTFKVAQGTNSSAEKQTEDFTAGLMGSPGGRLLVGVVGLVVLGIAGYHVYKGWTKKFLEGVDTSQAGPSARRWIERSGQVGYPAKGVALMIVGGLLTWAAITFNPKKAAGLDAALRSVLDVPFGKVLLTLVALGLVAFGVFCFFRARYPERT